MVKGLELYAESVDVVKRGIDNFDEDLLYEAADLINQGVEWTNKSTEEMKALTEELEED